MKAIIKETGQAVEVVSRFMPKKRNVPSRDWMCNLSNGTCINESELEYISDNIEGNRQRAEECVPNDLEEASDEYAEKHGFRVPYDGSDNFYDNVDVKASKEGFIAGAKWQMKKDLSSINKSYESGVVFGMNAQKEQDEKDLSEKIASAYQLGLADKEKQMMKEAVEGWVSSTKGDHFGCVTSVPTDLGKLYGADKCKIIIIKEDK